MLDAERTRKAIESRDPRTGELWRSWPHPTDAVIAEAARTARRHQPAWAALSLAARRTMIDRFRQACFARRHEIAGLIEREVGKSSADALAADVIVTMDLAAYFCRISGKVLRKRVETGASLAMLRKTVEIRREPFGVIAVISPWNYPFMLAAGVIIPSLLAGNAVVLKPSEYSTATAELLVELFREAGVPTGVVQCLPGDGVTGAALIEAGVDKVFFTGSVRAGRAVAESCARQMIPANLELGGNDPAIVLADADLHATARGLIWARFFTAGQSCVAPKRVLVDASVHDALVEAVKAEMLILTSGRGASSHVGPVVRPAQGAALVSQLEDAVARGARIAATVAKGPDTDGETWKAPLLLVDVPRDARLMQEEAFGPLLVIVRVTDLDDAIALANDSEFGLSASIWTSDPVRAGAIAGRLQVGTVLVNDAVVNVGIPNLPHGGVKASGTGRSHGAEGLLECTQVRTVVRDRVRWLPQPWWYTRDADHTAFLDAVARTSHAPSLLARLRAGIDTLRFWPRR